jgi:hypothetical protein
MSGYIFIIKINVTFKYIYQKHLPSNFYPLVIKKKNSIHSSQDNTYYYWLYFYSNYIHFIIHPLNITGYYFRTTYKLPSYMYTYYMFDLKDQERMSCVSTKFPVEAENPIWTFSGRKFVKSILYSKLDCPFNIGPLLK